MLHLVPRPPRVSGPVLEVKFMGAYPVYQNTGNNIGPRRCNFHSVGGLSGEDADFFRYPVLGSVAIGVHDNDEKNPRISLRQSSTGDVFPTVG